MVSTFHGLETARRGLNVSQSALYTTGHNISNVNTEGYTRQRVAFEAENPYNAYFGQLGTGVKAGVVERIRDNYLDVQYRSESTKLGYYEAIRAALAKMEDIMNEPSDTGLQAAMDKFWNSLQDLANNPQNAATRQVVASNGQMVAETFNYYYNSLERIQRDLGNEIDVVVRDINALVSDINDLNKQIATVEPHGQLPNDLYDKRDLLIDQLSKLVNVKINPVVPKQYGQHHTLATGLYEIAIVQPDGTEVNLISVDDQTGALQLSELKVEFYQEEGSSLKGLVKTIQVVHEDHSTTDIKNTAFLGELAGLIEAYGYNFDGETEKGYYPEMLENLNKLAFVFATEFNNIHRQGSGLNDEDQPEFFDFNYQENDNPNEYDPTKNYAKEIKVHEKIMSDPSYIAAAEKGGKSGDNSNAFRLADVKSKDFAEYFKDIDGNPIPGLTLPDGLNGNFDNYYAGLIGKLGVDAQSANRNVENVQVLLDSVDYNRQSVSAVSLMRR